MCDIYMEHCILCGEPIPWHLGDFSTGREELIVICDKHPTIGLQLRRLGIPFYIIKMSRGIPTDILSKILKDNVDALRGRGLSEEDLKYIMDFKEEIAKFSGRKFYVVPLTDNARINAPINHPNTMLDFEIEYVNWDTKEEEEGSVEDEIE